MHIEDFLLGSKYFLLFQCFPHILFLYLFNLNLWIGIFFFEFLKIRTFRSSKITFNAAGLGVLMAYCIAGLRSELGSFKMYKWQVHNNHCSLCCVWMDQKTSRDEKCVLRCVQLKALSLIM